MSKFTNKKTGAKRLLAALLTLVLVMGLFLTGCGKEEEATATGGLKENLGNRGASEPTEEQTGPAETEEPTDPEVPQPESDGWYVSADGNVYLFENGTACTGFYFNVETAFCDEAQFAPGWYYFDETGVMQRNCWIEEEGNLHCILESGVAAAPGWYSDEKGWYHLEDMGLLSRGDIQGEGFYCWMDSDGYLSQMKYDKLIGTSERGPVGSRRHRDYTVLNQPVENCMSFSFAALNGNMFKADGVLSWNLWLRIDGQWVDMKDRFDSAMGYDIVTVSFREPLSFDAVYIESLPGFCSHVLELLDVFITY